MKKKVVLFFLASVVCISAFAQVKLPKLISDGMVLQRNLKLKIWGWASAGENISVFFREKKYTTKADEQGNWMIFLPAQKPGGPYELRVKASNEINIKNILIGDVWLCSGQSNMELTMERLKYKYADEIKNGDNPEIRQFTVPDKYDFKKPQEDVASGQWVPSTGKDIYSFSGVAWFFAKKLYNRYKVPIGLINSALGGSPAEAWISEEAIRKFPAYYAEAQKFRDDALIDSIEKADKGISNSWYNLLNQTDEGLQNKWADPGFDDSGWEQFTIPGYWPVIGSGFLNGSAWFRKKIEVPASMIGQRVKLESGRIVDADSVFINGKFIGTTGYQYPPRRYELPVGTLKEGTNTIVIRVVSNSGRAGFVPGKRYELTTANDTVDLKGEWRYKTGSVMKALPAQTFIRWKPVGLYNAMIAPLTNYSIKGVIWYQGESNVSHPGNYKDLIETLINDWRKKWKQGEFPFVYVQLANFMEAKTSPDESNWAELRQQQLNVLTVHNTAMAVAIDVGDWNDIHPENKKEVGTRLALQAERIAYDDTKIISSGPLYQSVKAEGNKIIVSFSNTGKGLIIKGGKDLKQFALAGKDGKYEWAKAIIKGNKVIVWNDTIPHPVSLRYAWADNPEGANLYNSEGLPASPFAASMPYK
jgi:sialate O-acetylesterase